MKTIVYQVQLLIAAFALLPGFTFAGPFQNGSFENGLNPPTTSYRSLNAGNTDIDGWVVSSGRIDWCGTPCLPKDGLLSAQLVGNGSGISQTFDTISGQDYEISFSLQPGASVTSAVTINVTFGVSTYHAVIPTGPCCTWHDYSTTLPASSTSSTLMFTSVDAGSVGPFLDDVKVTSVATNSPPSIFTQPRSQTNTVGSTVTFNVSAGGTAPLAYQWLSNSLPMVNGGRVAGATSNALTISSLQLSDSDVGYSVIVTNAYGSATSTVATVTVTTNLTWTGAVSTDWNNPSNWNPQHIPTATDRVIINSGSVTAPADAAFTVLDWSGGSIYGSLTIGSNGVLNVSGAGVYGSGLGQYLAGVMTNYGTINWISGDWNIANAEGYANFNGALYNQAGALFNVQCDQTLFGFYSTFDGSGAGSGFIDNAGTLRKSAGTNTTYLAVALYNFGTVEVQSGHLRLDGGGSLSGQFFAATGTDITLFNGSFTETGLPVFSGGGQSQFARGTLTLTTDVIPGLAMLGGTLYLTPTFQGGSITNLPLAGMTLQAANVAVTGTLNWSGGSIYGSLTIGSNGVLNVSGAGVYGSGLGQYLAGVMTNYGTINWISGDWNIANAEGYANFNGALYNQAGALFNVQCDQTLFGFYSTFDGSGAGSGFINNAGTLRKSAGTNTTYLAVALNNSGTVQADIGTLRFQGGYSGNPSASLAISLGGTTPGSGYGKIAFANPLTVDGSFTISTRNGFRPNPGDTFNVLSYPSATNEFTCYSGLDLGAGLILQPQFAATGLTLLATAYATNSSQPQLFINRSLNGLLLTWPLGFPGWVLQSTTNLTSPLWSPVPVTCGNQAAVPIAVPRQFFRLSQ